MSIATEDQSSEGILRTRIAWVDAAKGLAIMLVVLTHAYPYLRSIGAESVMWANINEILSMLRMPLFFMLSGIFARSWVRRPWGDLLRGKVLFLMWVYVVWVLIRFAFFAVVPNLVAPNESSSFFRLIVQSVWSSTPTWFLYALALFFIGAKSLSRLPLWMQFSLAAFSSIIFMSNIIVLPSSLWSGIFEFFVFFLIGLYGSKQMITSMRNRTVREILIAWCIIWFSVAITAVLAGWSEIPGVKFLVAVLALPAGIALGQVLSRSKVMVYLGRNTMQIYLAHTLIQGGLVYAMRGWPDRYLTENAWWLPVVLVIVSAIGSLLLAELVRKCGVSGIYDKPAWVDAVALRIERRIRSRM